jgi:hypothetical protein
METKTKLVHGWDKVEPDSDGLAFRHKLDNSVFACQGEDSDSEPGYRNPFITQIWLDTGSDTNTCHINRG